MRHDWEWGHVEEVPLEVCDDAEQLRRFVAAAEDRARAAIAAKGRTITDPMPVVDLVYVRPAPAPSPPARRWLGRRAMPAATPDEETDRAHATHGQVRVVFVISARVVARRP